MIVIFADVRFELFRRFFERALTVANEGAESWSGYRHGTVLDIFLSLERERESYALHLLFKRF